MKTMKETGTGALKARNGLTNSMSYDYLYCDSTYGGVYMTNLDRLVKNKDTYIKNATIQLTKIKPKDEPFIIIEKEQDRYPGVLKTRRCFAGLVSNEPAVLHVIWFDDGKKSLEESLMDILPDIDWDNNAKNFEY